MLLLVSGASQAGKSFFSSLLARSLEESGISALVLSTDMFYRNIPPQTNLREHNFDSLGSLESDYMIASCEKILQGRSLEIETFEFKTHRRSGKMHVETCDVLIVEGIFALCYDPLKELAALKIFIDTDEALCKKRRFERYSHVLGQSDEFIAYKYYSQAKPFFDGMILPAKKSADHILDGGRPFDDALANICGTIRTKLNTAGMCK